MSRVTATKPICPKWCTVPAAEHEEEAHERSGSWFFHRRIMRDDDQAHLEISQLQMFGEQREDADETEERPYMIIEVKPEVVQYGDALDIAASIVQAAELMGDVAAAK